MSFVFQVFSYHPFPTFSKLQGVHLSDISGTCAAWVTTVSQNFIFHVLILRRPPGHFFFYSQPEVTMDYISRTAAADWATEDLSLTPLLKTTLEVCSTRSTKFHAPTTARSLKATWQTHSNFAFKSEVDTNSPFHSSSPSLISNTGSFLNFRLTRGL